MIGILAINGLIILLIRALEPHRYPAGDPRNEPLFWLVLVGTFGTLLVVGLVVAIRLALASRRRR
jgi:hypothetical protein